MPYWLVPREICSRMYFVFSLFSMHSRM